MKSVFNERSKKKLLLDPLMSSKRRLRDEKRILNVDRPEPNAAIYSPHEKRELWPNEAFNINIISQCEVIASFEGILAYPEWWQTRTEHRVQK